MATSIPSSLRQLDLSQFAISRIALHNATASPALTISALPPSGFVVRSHTQDRIEYVQDPKVSLPAFQESSLSKGSAAVVATSSNASSSQDTATATTATTAAATVGTTTPQPEMPVLLLKVHSDQGFRLTFELEGRLVEQLSSSVTQATGERQQQQPQQSNTSPLEGGAPSSEQRENPPMGNAHEDTGSKEHGHGPEDLANTFPRPSQAPGLFFAETSSEQELEDLCRESDFQSMLKEHAVTTVEFPVIYDGTESAATTAATPNQQHESTVLKSHAWDWTYTPKDHVDDELQGHKTVFAFLLRDASSGTVKVLSQFSFWIIDLARPEQYTVQRFPIPPPSPSTAVHRHWRRASTPEKLSSSMNRLTSFQAKLVSIPTSHLSLSSLPEAAAGAIAPATGGVQALSSSTATMAGDSSSQALSLSNASPFVPDTEDGPLFRATVVECENHIRDMKASTKRIIKAAQTVLDARKSWTMAEEIFIKELEGFKPAEPLLNAFLRPMALYLSEGSEKLGQQMRNLLIEPLTRFYENDIKVAESYRKAFDDESKEYYTFLSRYMAMKQESNRKKSDADAKYEKKRRHFELKRFEYWSFLLDMRVGGSKSDEILHHLTNYSEKYNRNVMELALLADELKPGLNGISADLLESQKRAVSLRRERQERRKELMEMNDETLGSQSISKSGSGLAMNSGSSSHSGSSPSHQPSAHADSLSDSQALISSKEPSGEQLMEGGSAGQDHRPRPISGTSQNSSTVFGSSSSSSSSAPAGGQGAKFSGIRDLEHQDTDAGTALGRRKEGFLFATSRPSLHNNSAVLEKPNINWHKYWCVLSEGQLHEYSHWKKGATMPHNEPINLKIATVRACRNQDRRFCFEVITPKFRRVYQATSTEDMNSWIGVISNAIQSLLNGTSSGQSLDTPSGGARGLEGQTIVGRSSMEQVMQALPSGHVQGTSDGKSASDHGSRRGASESSNEQDHCGSRLLQVMRETHPANSLCAECGAKNPDWCAINLGILICIECSGIHRSLGTHISKVRSFTLDTTSYTRDLFDFIRAVGNNVSNEIWEARLVQTASVPSVPSSGQGDQDESHPQLQQQEVVYRKPAVNDGREFKVAFIQKKYIERVFVDKKRLLASEVEDTGAGTEEDNRMAATRLLFKAVVANDMAGVIAAFACGADLNAVEEAELDDGGGDSWTETSETNSVPTTPAAVTAAATPEVGGENSDSLQVIEEESELIAHSPGLETSKSTLTSTVLNIPGARGSSHGRSSFRVMETSPLLLALRNGVPFSLDEQYEVYPMAEFMLQNGATSNLSVEVQMIDDELDSNTSTDNNIATNGMSSSTDGGNKNGWDSTLVDPEDIRNFQQRSNRRSLGQVVHMRGEGGVAAMEYLRGKSAARGEAMPGSSSPLTGNAYGDPKAPIGSSSPPATSAPGNFSPRLRPQTLTVGVNSLSAPTSVVSSPSGPGGYSTTVLRGAHASHSTSIQQDIASLFQKRRVSDGGLGPALVAAAKATDATHEKQQSKDAGPSSSSQLQPPHSMDLSTSSSSSSATSSPTQHRATHGHGIHSSSSPHQHSLHVSSSRAHKVKATLSKSLRLSAAYLKNNMLKEERDHHPMPVFSSPSQSLNTSTSASTNSNTNTNTNTSTITNVPAAGAGGVNASASETDTRNLQDNATGAESEEPLSGPYVILNPRVKQ